MLRNPHIEAKAKSWEDGKDSNQDQDWQLAVA